KDHKTLPKKKRTQRDGDKEGDPEKPKLSTPARVYASMGNVARHMEHNAKLLYESTQEEFPERTMEAGKRIYNEMGNTFYRTVRTMKKMADFVLWDDNDGDGDNDMGGGPKRR
ncbi:MAG: hypothetical protein SGARI_005952, partial [Bacillariaceae sp.]